MPMLIVNRSEFALFVAVTMLNDAGSKVVGVEGPKLPPSMVAQMKQRDVKDWYPRCMRPG